MHSAQFQWKVLVQLGANISSLRDERLPKGPRFACESLDADTANGSAFFKLTHYPVEQCIAPEQCMA